MPPPFFSQLTSAGLLLVALATLLRTLFHLFVTADAGLVGPVLTHPGDLAAGL